MKYLLTLLACTVATSSLCASLINFQSGALNSFLQADGSTSLSAEAEGTYQFALGTFDELVLSGTSDTWLSGFVDQMEATNVWKVTGPGPLQNRFQNERLMNDGTSSTENAYIFGYRNDLSEVVIFRNASWVFPSFNALDVTADVFSLQDANTEVVTSLGGWASFNNNLTMLAAVPEPSAFALLAGAFGIAAVMVRRRR